MVGANPISYLEIDAWARLTSCAPSPWEVSVLRRMDSACMARQAKDAPISKDEPTQIDASDGREVVGFMRAMAARRRG